MKKSLLASALITAVLTAQSAFAVNVHCSFEHGETLSYNEKNQRLIIVDPHSSDPKVETLNFSKIQLVTNGARSSDGKLNRLQLMNAKNKLVLDVQRGQVENPETGELSVFKGTWDIGFGKILGGCSVSK